MRLPSNPSKDYYFMLRDTANNESVIVEYGFIDTTTDANQVKNNYEKYAEAVVRAIADYKGIPYTNPTDEYYTVKKGDTLWGISNKYGVSVSKLKELNNLSTNILKIGQILKISDSTLDNEEIGVESDEFIYKVSKGDNLYSIANKYGITVQDLIDYNNLSTTVLQIGQILNIPGNYKTYTVVKGDSLWKIANNNNTTVNKIKSINNLTSNVLQIGQKLLIPNS